MEVVRRMHYPIGAMHSPLMCAFPCFFASYSDDKLASIHDIKGRTKKKIRIISGPTHDQQPTFDFLNTKCNGNGRYSFNGLPTYFDFPWIEYETELFDY